MSGEEDRIKELERQAAEDHAAITQLKKSIKSIETYVYAIG